MMWAWVRALSAWWMPRVDDPEVRSRSRFLIQTWFIGWPMTVVAVAIYASQRLWVQVALNGLLVVLGPLVLSGLKRTGRLAPWVQLSLGATLLAYGPGILLRTPFDDTAIFFACVVPLAAGYTLGGASAARWSALTVVVAVAAMVLGHFGFTVALAGEAPLIAKVLNVGTPLVMVSLFALSTERAHARNRLAARSHREKLRGMVFNLTQVSERRRRRVAVELHEGVGQRLAVALLRLRDSQRPGDPQSAQSLAQGIELLDGAVQDTRSLTFELSPPLLYDLGLPAALGWLSERFSDDHQVHVRVDAPSSIPSLDGELSAILFLMVRELLTNVVKHSSSKVASVTLQTEGGRLCVVVADTGAGFDAGRLERPDGRAGFGLFGVREHILSLGGTFTVTSRRGQGTKVELCVPLPERAAKGDEPLRVA